MLLTSFCRLSRRTKRKLVFALLISGRALYAADVDSDGDMDVLSTTMNTYITWWENDGSQNFTNHTIESGSLVGAVSVYATDIDSDGDVDVLGVHSNDSVIAWWEQLP